MTTRPAPRKRTLGLLLQNRADRDVLWRILAGRYRIRLLDDREKSLAAWREVDLLIADMFCARRFTAELADLKKKPESSLLPILLLLPGQADAAPWLEAGCDDILRMPVKKTDLFLRLKTLEGMIDQAEARAAEAGQRVYQEIFDGAGDAMLLIDPASRQVSQANRAARDLFGYSAQQLGQLSFDELVYHADPAERSDFLRTVFPARDGRRPHLLDCSARDREGRVFPVSISLIGLRLADNRRILAIIRDMEEQKQLEDQLRQAQKMEAVGHLAGGIAHDFNNILAGIIGYTSVLQHKLKENPQAEPILESILKSADRAAALTKGMLAFSRKQVMTPRQADLNAVLEQARPLLEQALGSGVTLDMQLADRPLPVRIDTVQTEQVLVNLAINARQAMPAGGTLSVKTASVELARELTEELGLAHQRDYAQILVADDGPGMGEEVRCRIFEPFFTTKEVGQGTGLGLSISFGIVKQMGGIIDCHSQPGQGATFRICLPLGDQFEEEAAAADTPASWQNYRGKETVLLAEDDTTVLEMTRQLLEEFGYRVLTAGDGLEAVAAYRKHADRIDLLFFDLNMPKLNGREAYEKIRSEAPGCKVIFTSGYPVDFLRDNESLSHNINFLMKPTSPARLLEKVRTVLDG